MNERFDSDELAAAAQLDRAVDGALANRPVEDLDPATATVLRRLVELHRVEPPPTLRTRVATAVRRRNRLAWLPARIAAAALGLTFVGQGVGSLLLGRWVARNLHVAFDPHLLFEGGIVLLALGGVVASGVLGRRRLDLAVVAGAPVGLAFGIHGWPELSEFPAGGALHLSQGVAAVALVVCWWLARRYGLAPSTKRDVGG